MEVADDPLRIRQSRKLTEIEVSRCIQRSQSCLAPGLGYRLDELEVTVNRLDRLGPAHGAVTRHDRLSAKRPQLRQRLPSTADGPLHEKRGAPIEDEIAAEEHTPLRYPDDGVVQGVGGRANMADLADKIIDVHANPVLKGEEWRRQFDRPPVDVGPEGCRLRLAPRGHPLAYAVMGDDGGAVEQVVAEGVVAVMMRVDEGAHGSRSDRRNRPEIRLGPQRRRTGIDAHHPARSDEEAGVVDPPSPFSLHIREDSVADLHGLAKRSSSARTGLT